MSRTSLPGSRLLKRRIAPLLAAALLAACSGAPTLVTPDTGTLPARVELDAVPFYPQDPYQCGPQSLAMALSASGVDIAPTALVDAVYVPGKQGSFSAELRAAARSHGRLPYRIEPTLDALMTALADGYPVLILQNLGLGFAPTWHFAVVIGYDREQDHVILRTGPDRRKTMGTRYFERRWRLGDYWGIALLGPEDFPAWLRKGPYEDQLALLEGAWASRLPGIYDRMLGRWPDSATAHLGLGNAAAARQDWNRAEQHYRTVLASQPNNIAALNNLAYTEAEQGNRKAAIELACRARALAQGHPLEATVAATLEDLAPGDNNPCDGQAALRASS